jgi:hypothetical protein
METDKFERLVKALAALAYPRPINVLPSNAPGWVGLTDEEWESMYDKFAKYQEYGAFVSGWDNFARAIEAALKEKNT